MDEKVLIISDPGVDGAFALTLALLDPSLDVQAICATAGNVSAEQATRNVHILIEQLDPPRLPRIGDAPPMELELNGTKIHGRNGLGGVELPYASLHHPHPADKLILDLARQFPHELTILVLGPTTVLAHALDRAPELSGFLRRIVFVGGAWHVPGDVRAVAEMHVACDPLSARQVLRSDVPVTLIPLDVSQKLILSPTELQELPGQERRATRLLSRIVPYAIGATESQYGVEGFHLLDVVGVIALSAPQLLTTQPAHADVEEMGELTRGMTVIDTRWSRPRPANIDLAVDLNVSGAKEHIREILSHSR